MSYTLGSGLDAFKLLLWVLVFTLRLAAFEVSLARRQNRKLAWEDAWNHGRINLSVKWLSHRSVRP